jgi:hypothetical protein
LTGLLYSFEFECNVYQNISRHDSSWKKNKKTEKNKKKQKTKLKATSWSSLFHGEGNTSFGYKELKIMEIALF